jgi:hypothetical protein
VRVKISPQKQCLEEKHAGRPHRWSAAKPRKEILSHDQLDLKEQKGADKNCNTIRQKDAGVKQLFHA